MTTRHSPGPWRRIGPLGEDYSLAIWDAEAKDVVDAKTPISGANAHLIVASPDLLHAAMAVLRAREDGTFGEDGQQGFKLLEDAVAKAGGKS